MEACCRVCMSTNDPVQMRSLLASNEDSCGLNAIYQLLTSLKVSQSDGLPSSLCVQCWQHLTKIRMFRVLCIQSDRIYRNQFRTGCETVVEEKHDFHIEETYPIEELNNNEDYQAADTIEECRIEVQSDQGDEQDTVQEDAATGWNGNPEEDYPIEVQTNNEDDQYLDAVRNDDAASEWSEHVEYLDDNDDVDATIPTDLGLNSVKRERRRSRRTIPALSPHGGPERFECDLCGQIYLTKSNLLNHLQRHLGIKTIRCGDCDATFAWHRQLHTHRLRCHTSGPLQQFKCEYANCTKSYLMKNVLRDHVRIAHLGRKKNVKKYVCETCGVLKNSTAALKSHMHLHQDPSIWPFPCGSCSARFRSKLAMKYHYDRRHLKIRNVPCTECDARFVTNGELRQHMISHKDGPSEQCPHCAKLLTSRTGLKYHIKRVHDEFKRHTCDQCEKSYTVKCDLTSHMRSVHLAEHKYRKGRTAANT